MAAVQRTAALVSRAQAGDGAAAAEAASALRVGTGTTQPQILDDLEARPPLLGDAAQRLDALQQELASPIATGDGARADQEVRSILAEPRYQPSGPNLLQVIEDWILQQLARLFVGRGGAAEVLRLLMAFLAVVVGGVLLVVLLRALWSRRGGAPARLRRRDPAARAAHSFAEADRLAAAADYLGAVKALTSAVATTVGGIGMWEASPFTVRELFREKRILESLQPLVVPFEAAAYGGRVPDAVTYGRAAAAAAAYREGGAAPAGVAAGEPA